MQALKILVVVMGVMIFAGVGVIAVTIAKRAGMGVADSGPGNATRPAEFGERQVPIPPEANLIDETVGGDNLVLELRLADDSVRYVVVDLVTGRTRGTLDLVEGR